MKEVAFLSPIFFLDANFSHKNINSPLDIPIIFTSIKTDIVTCSQNLKKKQNNKVVKMKRKQKRIKMK